VSDGPYCAYLDTNEVRLDNPVRIILKACVCAVSDKTLKNRAAVNFMACIVLENSCKGGVESVATVARSTGS